MRRAAILFVAAGCLCAQPAGVTGTVADQTGKPLAGVHVRLLSGDLGAEDRKLTVYGAISDKAGHFSLDAVPPGLYFVMAERAGWVQQISDLATIAVKPGETTDYKIAMAARAAISGHVLDEYGDPVQNVNVQAESVTPNQPEAFALMRPFTQTDDRGEFRMIAGPGKYYLKASEMQGARFGPQEIRTDGTPSAPFITTYYPSAASTGAASVIEAAAGQDLTDMDIRLLRSGPGTARTFSVSGAVTGVPENARADVMLRFGEAAGKYYNGTGVSTEQDGTFKISGMQPGYYSIAASYTGGKTALQSRTFEFHLESADQTGIQLTLAPGEELTGKLELVGDPAAGESTKHTVRLEAGAWGNQFGQGDLAAAEVAPDGSFHITGIAPGKFKPVVEPMPENGFLKEVTLDNTRMADNVLDFTQGVGGSRLTITVSRKGGRISGRVLDKDGQPTAGLVMVFLASDAKLMGDENSKRALDGRYEIKGIRPGKYRIFAFDVLQMASLFGAADDNEKMMQQLFDSAEEIEIKEGDAISKDVTVIVKVPEKKERP